MKIASGLGVAAVLVFAFAGCTKPASEQPVGQGVTETPATESYAAQTIDCTSAETRTKRSAMCAAVIDPMKAEKGEISKIDCGAELQDGYEVGICQGVDPAQQEKLSKK